MPSVSQSEDVVMMMEFDDAESDMSSEDVGLAARLSKKTKSQAKERGKTGENYLSLKSCQFTGVDPGFRTRR